jgi:hypothetical protein
MSWVPAERVIGAVQTQRQVLAAEEARAAGFDQYHAAERAKLEAERTRALSDLGQVVLPRLDHASIAAAAQAVGLAGLPAEDVPARLEARRQWLAARLSAILVDPRYRDRELLRHPRTGSLMTAIAQNEDYRKPAADVIATCDAHPRFEGLWTGGFGTPEQGAKWWRYSYWQDRSAASELVSKFEGKTTFAEVRDEYARAKETASVFDAELAKLRAEVAAGEALEREYATLHEEHRTLDARGLEHTRGRIVEHMLSSDASLVAARLRALPKGADLLLLFLRASGIAAKVSYLDGIQRTNLAEIRKDIAVQRERLDSVETRTRKRWAPMPLDKFRKLEEDRRPRYEKRWQRFGKTYTVVHAYDRYDRGRFYEDLLWWDLMTRGRHDGSFLPDVADFHRRHPDYAYDADWKGLATAQREAHAGDASDAADASDAGSDVADAAAAILEVDAGDGGGPSEIERTDAS